MLSRLSHAPPRVKYPVSLSRRALVSRYASTQATDAPAPESTPKATRAAPAEAHTGTSAPERRPIRVQARPKSRWTAFVRCWRPPRGAAESLAVIAEIEKQFGKIRRSHFLRDYETEHRYQMMALVIFEDSASIERIPLTGIDLTVDTTLLPQHEPHMLELKDIVSLMTPSEAVVEQPSTGGPNDKDLLGFRLIPSDHDYNDTRNYFVGDNRIHQRTPLHIKQKFTDWGGFSSKEPMVLPEQLYGLHELFNPEAAQPNIRMLAALKLCEQSPLFAKSQPNSPAQPVASAPTSAPVEPKEEMPTPPTNKKPTAPSKPSKPPKPSPKQKEKEKEALKPATPSAPQTDSTPKSTQLSKEAKRELEEQIQAARQAQQKIAAKPLPKLDLPTSSHIPTRRKQSKPRPTSYVHLDTTPPAPKEAPKTGGGFLGKLWPLIGRKS